MSYNKHWPRWIEASILKHINTNKGTYHLFTEGQDRKTSEHEKWIEARLDGPWARQLSAANWRLIVELNILVSVDVGRNIYEPSVVLGDVATMFTNSIEVFKLGNGPDDNPAVSLGCLTLDTSDDNRGIRIDRFGQIGPKTPLIQASVEGRYWIDL